MQDDNVKFKFNRLAHAAGIRSDDVRAIAEMFFKLGLSFGLKDEPEKLCKLVSDTSVLHLTVGCEAVYTVENLLTDPGYFTEDYYETLTQEELQFMTHVFRSILNEFEHHRTVVNRAVDYFWNQSDPTNPDTAREYRELNNVKNIKRELKSKTKKLAEIQRKLKNQLRK